MQDIKERESKGQWIKRKHQDIFRGSNHCSTSPPSHRRISTKASTQDFPHREPPLRIWVIQTQSTQLHSQTTTSTKRQDTKPHKINLSIEGQSTKPNNNYLTLEGQAQSQINHNHLYTQRDINTAKLLHNHLYTRGITTKPNKRRLQLLVISTNHKQIFLKKQ